MALPTSSSPGYGLFRGRVACDCLIEWLPVYERMMLAAGEIKFNLDIIQLTGAASASAGTHSQGGAADLVQRSDRAVAIARRMGARATWRRVTSQGFSGDHMHVVLTGCPHNEPARYQISAVRAGFNGLGYLGRGGLDYHPDPPADVIWSSGIAWAEGTLDVGGDEVTPEDRKAIIDGVVAAVMGRLIDNPVEGGAPQPFVTSQWSQNRHAWLAWQTAIDASAGVTALRAELNQNMAALTAAIKELGGSVNPDPGPVNPWPSTTGPIYGADVSGHQTLDVCRGIAADKTKKFVIVKATEGKTFVNDLYDEQMAMFRAAAMFTGAYHFWWPTNTPMQDFDHYVATAQLKLGEVPVLDAENWDQVHKYADMANLPSWLDRLLWAIQWCDLAEDHFGARPWIYLNWNWIKQFRQAAGMVNADGSIKTTQTELWQRLTASPLWGANPFKPAGQFEAVSGGWNAGIICHQYGESPYDLDYLYGADASAAWWSHGIKKGAA